MDGYVSEQMRASRISVHGQITNLSEGFKLDNNLPFSIFLKPKASTSEISVVLSCQLYQDNIASNCPFNIDQWSEASVLFISINETILNDYDIYWGAGG